MRQFAISCYKSELHRWWFKPHPPQTLNMRHKPPRFIVPRCKLMRDHKRPIVTYTEVLNSLTDEEWARLKLPPVATVRHAPNVQLADLGCPSFIPATIGTGPYSGSVVVPARVIEDVDCASDAIEDAVLSVEDVVAFAVAPAPLHDVAVPEFEFKQCHQQCFPGLGGESICLFRDMTCDDYVAVETDEGGANLNMAAIIEVSPPSTSKVWLSPSNSPASEYSVVLAEENLGLEPAPHQHQAGSIPGVVKPPSPCPGFNN